MSEKIIHYGIDLLPPNFYSEMPCGLQSFWEVTWGVPILDRTNTLLFPIEYEVLSPIPEIDHNFNKSFKEICLERALDIWKLSDLHNKEVCVYWSGGIDSTTALVSLLLTASRDHLDKLIVRYSHMSLAEYILFFEKFIKNKLRSENYGYSIAKYNTDRINVTGELGDQIFGSTMMYPYYKTDLYTINKDWRENFNTLFKFSKVSEEKIEPFIDYISPLTEKAPFRLKSSRDVFWWLNFSCKWQDVQMRMLRGITLSREEMHNSLHHFFDYTNFQKWSMNEDNHNKYKIGDTWQSYKMIAKDLIHEYTQDKDYRNNKLKVGSLRVSPNYTYSFRYSDMRIV